MRIWHLIVALLIGLGPAHAQDLTVRSGEHDGFTRLVVPIGAERDWAVDEAGSERRISFSPEGPAFDLTAVFDRATRDRLGSIAMDGDLVLTLACDCPLSLFRFQETFLVIDILDPEDEAPPTEIAETPPETEIGGTEAQAASAPADSAPVAPQAVTALDDSGLAAPRPAPNTDRVTPLPDPFATPPRLETVTLPQRAPAEAAPAPTPPPSTASLAEAADHLAEQLARAAAAGLVEAQPEEPLSIGDPIVTVGAEETADVSAETGGDMAPMPDTETLPGLALRAETAFDALRHDDGAGVTAQPPLSCTPEATLNIADWSAGLGFEQEIGRLRARLYDDRDQVQPDAAADLARYYIYHGFGHEAVFWFEQDPNPPPLEHAVARVLRGDPGPVFPAIDGDAHCGGAELLWRYLDDPGHRRLAEDEEGPVLQAFAALPAGLRDILGPDLARRLQSHGAVAAAQDISDALTRGGRLSTNAERMLDMDISPTPAIATTLSALEEVMRTDRSRTPDAMMRYLALHREAGTAVSPDWLIAAEALLRETAAAPEPNGLWHEILLSHAASDELGQSLEMLADVQERAFRQQIVTELFRGAVERDDLSAMILLSMAEGEAWVPTRATTALRQALASRFLDEGLTSLALAIAPSGQPIAPSAAPNAQTLAPEDQAWRVGNWEELLPVEEGPYAGFATRILEDQAAPAEELPVEDLARLTVALSESAETRDLIQEMLRAGPPGAAN